MKYGKLWFLQVELLHTTLSSHRKVHYSRFPLNKQNRKNCLNNNKLFVLLIQPISAQLEKTKIWLSTL